MSELTGGARPLQDAGRERPHPTDWQRIETEKTDRDAARRTWDQRHDPSEEFEKAAQPLPDDYGSHRPKHPDLTPEQVAEIEEFTGRSIDQVLAARERDPRAGHNRENTTDTSPERIGAQPHDQNQPEATPAGRDTGQRAPAVIRFGSEETGYGNADLNDRVEPGETGRDPRTDRTVGYATDAAADTAQLESSDRPEEPDTGEQPAEASVQASSSGRGRVIDLEGGLRLVDHDHSPSPSSTQAFADTTTQADGAQEPGGWVAPQQSPLTATDTGRGAAEGERPWWMQDRPSADALEGSDTTAQVTNETREPGERRGETPSQADEPVVLHVDDHSPPELGRAFVLNHLAGLAGTDRLDVFKEVTEPGDHGEARRVVLEATEVPGEDARSAVALERMREAGLPMSGARYDTDPAVKAAVAMYLDDARSRILISPRSWTADEHSTASEVVDDHRFPSFVRAVEAVAPDGARVRLYGGVHGQSVVLTGHGRTRWLISFSPRSSPGWSTTTCPTTVIVRTR